jgi:hypothetical protein
MDGVDPKMHEVIKTYANSVEIAGAVPVRIADTLGRSRLSATRRLVPWSLRASRVVGPITGLGSARTVSKPWSL